MAQVALKAVKKSFGSVEVIHGIDLEITDEEFVALVGPSGCGKSTLLRMIAGLEELTSGSVVIGDADVTDLMPRDRDIAMVFQSYALYPHMTVRENMAFSLRLRKASEDEIERAVGAAAETLGLTEYLERRPKDLSGGQRQRVAMGRAIVRQPKVFLFDEPLSNLDAKLRVTMRAEVIKLHRRLATTSIYVTHDQVEAMTMADRIVVMRAGSIVQVGAPLELYDRPRDVFVAQFIGTPTMNMAPATVRDGEIVFLGGRARLPVRGDVPGGVLLGVRPEHVKIVAPGAGTVDVEIDLIEPMGNETLVSCRVEGEELQVITNERLSLESGETVGLSFAEDRLHLFDAETQVRLDAAIAAREMEMPA